MAAGWRVPGKTHANFVADQRVRKELRGRKATPFIEAIAVKFRRLIIALYLLLFLAIGAASSAYFWDAREELERLRERQAVSRRRLAEVEAKLHEQEKILERLRSDPVYVEKVIRQRLGYAKPDEYIFRFEDSNP